MKTRSLTSKIELFSIDNEPNYILIQKMLNLVYILQKH